MPDEEIYSEDTSGEAMRTAADKLREAAAIMRGDAPSRNVLGLEPGDSQETAWAKLNSFLGEGTPRGGGGGGTLTTFGPGGVTRTYRM